MNQIIARVDRYLLKNATSNHLCIDQVTDFFKKVNWERLGLGLNGGKDSTAALFLVLYFKAKFDIENSRLKCIYFKEDNPFPEIIQYINTLKETTNIHVTEYNSRSSIDPLFMKKSLNDFVLKNDVAFFVTGNRRTDPGSQNLQLMSKSNTEDGWPDSFRVMPLYNWSYQQIWEFIDETQLPYCPLYHKGYTYVGDQNNTIPNPFLKYTHARNANDNIELFSRSSLWRNLLTSKGEILLQSSDILLFLRNPKQLIGFEKFINCELKPKLLRFFEEKGIRADCSAISSDLKIVDINNEFEDNQSTFNQTVLLKKSVDSKKTSRLLIGLFCDSNQKITQFLI